MVEVLEVVRIAFIIFWAIVVYELLRTLIKQWVKKRLERDLNTFLQNPDLYHQRFKFTNKLVIKNQLLSDAEINDEILAHSRREGVTIGQARAKVETYVDEIVPQFNMLSYYKLGYTVARAFIHLLYDPVVDRHSRRVLDELPPDATPVYVMNHRSNVDFVLLAYILAGRVSVSYAVGEWARVWPLEHLFKSFGSYLIRRGYKEELYHTVLRRYVQLTARHGVAQAFFPEGRLTRDGRLLAPKMGLMNWLAGIEAEPGFAGRLVFIPVAVNYDWVLEDDTLVHEAQGIREEKKGLAKKIGVVVIGPFVFLGLLVANGIRRLFGRLKLHGYASLAFGRPLELRRFMQEQGVEFGALGYEQRKPHVGALADEVMKRLAAALPATPATTLSVALLDHEAATFDRRQAVPWVTAVVARLRQADAPFVHGHEFRRVTEALEKEREELPRGQELQEVELGFVAQEEAEEIVRLGLDVLRRNKILLRRGDTYRVRPGREAHLRYYANSIAHHLGRTYPITPAAEAAEAAEAASQSRPGSDA